MAALKETLKSKGLDASHVEERINQSKIAKDNEMSSEEEEDNSSSDSDMQDEERTNSRLAQKKMDQKIRSFSRSRSKGFRKERTPKEIVIFVILIFRLWTNIESKSTINGAEVQVKVADKSLKNSQNISIQEKDPSKLLGVEISFLLNYMYIKWFHFSFCFNAEPKKKF